MMMMIVYVFNDYDGTVCIDIIHTSVHNLIYLQVA
jgi:hypothetical protein